MWLSWHFLRKRWCLHTQPAKVDSCFDKYYSREFPQCGTGQSRGLPGDLPLSAPHQCWLEVCLPELSTWSQIAGVKHGPQEADQSKPCSPLNKRSFPRAVVDFLLPHLNSSSLPKRKPILPTWPLQEPWRWAGPLHSTVLSCDNRGWGASAFLYITRAALILEGVFSSGRRG